MNPCQRVYKKPFSPWPLAAAPLVLALFAGFWVASLRPEPVEAESYTFEQQQEPDLKRTLTPRSEMFTVEHDGHHFVAFSSGGLLHHPDCPCRER